MDSTPMPVYEQKCMVGDAHLSYRTWGFFGITVPHPNILRLAGGSTPKNMLVTCDHHTKFRGGR